MPQAKVKFASFEDYLDWSNDPDHYLEGRFEWVDGELVSVEGAKVMTISLVDPIRELVTALVLVDGLYEAIEYRPDQTIVSPSLPALQLTANQVLGV
jgi:hypothetical protein